MSDAVTPTAPAVSDVGSGSVTKESRKRRRERDWIGSSIGLVVFLGGVALLVIVFRLSYDMFQTPPTVALEIQGGKTLDLGRASDRASAILVKVVVLLIMAIAGSLVANRGILMYSRSSGR
ncbi:hypothetical protein EON79_18480 [bacterium]|nr:MAG: hypothetical protein EON79_18480 [bacterium]